jgi:hypothetical protein
MIIKNIKLRAVRLFAAIALAVTPFVAMSGVSSASGTVNWTGQGAESVKTCGTDQTPYLHWIFTTGGDSDVSAVSLTVGGDASGGGAMSQHGGSWTINTAYSGTGQPTTSTVQASVAYTGELGKGTANLVISDGCFGEGGQGGGPVTDCDGDTDESPSTECQQPQKDCDNDTDNSPATECEAGGLGGGPTTTQGQVLAISTTAGVAQVTAVPQGSVNGGGGAGSKTVSTASTIGLLGSLFSVGAGFTMLNRRNN